MTVVYHTEGSVHRVIDAAWETPDTATLARILTRLRAWNPSPEPRRRTPGAPQFGTTYRRASPADPLIDITMPRSPGRSPVACPPPLFRRPVEPTAPTSESGS
jgi:hypothetical protein